MASGPSLHKTIADITGLIQDLKTNFEETQSPVNDDNSFLSRLLIKLEYIFQLDLQAKHSILGTKKSYWDYFYKCLAGKRNLNDGIRFVKAISEIQTSEGRGRAFIRFCLMHHCLADSLQQCFLNDKTTRVWFGESSPLRSEYQFSHLISSLYELNEIDFELNPLGCELDIGWPAYARKSFDPYSWRVPSRAMSISSFCSAVSTSVERDSFCKDHFKINPEDTVDLEEDVTQALTDQNAELNKRLEEKENEWLTERTKLENELIESKKMIDSLKASEKAGISDLDKTNHSQMEKQIKLMEKSLTDAYKNAQTLLNSFQTKVSTVESKIQEFDKTNPVLSDPKANNEQLVPIAAPAVKEFLEDVSSIHFSAQDLILTQKGFLEKMSNLMKVTNELQHLHGFGIDSPLHNTKDKENIRKTELEMSTIERMEQQIEALKNALKASKEITEIKDLEITKLRTEIQGIKLSNDIKMKNGESSSPENDDGKLRKQLVDLLAKVKGLQEEKLTIGKKLSDIESGKDILERRVFEMVKKLKESETQVRQTNEKLKNVLHLVDVQGDQNTKLQEQLVSTKKENGLLITQMKTLNDLLQEIEKKEKEIEPQVEPKEEIENNKQENQSIEDQQQPDSTKNDVDQPIVKKVARTLSRLHSLIDERNELQRQLKITKEMTAQLTSKVAEQEQQLANVTTELTETQEFIDKLRSACSKLQTSDAILRHELKEKRHLLNKLKAQLESSRNQWKQVQQKNFDNETQWQELRDEFDNRRLKSAEEASTSSDKPFEPSSPNELKGADGGLSISNPDLLAGISLSPDESNPLSEEEDARDRRLKFLEHQCRMLYEKLLKSAKYGAALDMRLASLHEHFGSGDTENSAISTPDEQENNEEYEVEGNAVVEGETNEELEREGETEPPLLNMGNVVVNEVIDDVLDKVVNETTEEEVDDDDKNKVVTFEVDTPADSSPEKPSAFDMAHALPKRIEKLRKEREDLQKKFKKVHGEKLTWEAKEAEYIIKIESLTKEKNEFSKQNENKSVDEKFIAAKEELKEKVIEIGKQLDERTAKINILMEEMELTKKSSEQEILALQFQLNTETLKHQQAIKECNDQEERMKGLQECIRKQDVTITHLQEKLKIIEDERESEQAEQWRQLSELKQALLNKDEDSAKTVLSSIVLLEEEHARSEKYRAEVEELKSNLSYLESQIAQLEADNEQMKLHIVKQTKEKDELWKENFEKKVQANVEMVNPSGVTQCTNCKVDFGFGVLLRKHHCRLCGQIFCYQCVDHWIVISDSTESVRVCDCCFARNNSQTEVKNNQLSDDIQDHNSPDEANGSILSPTSDLPGAANEEASTQKSDDFHVVTDQELTESMKSSSSSFSLSDNQDNLILNEVWTEDDIKNLSAQTKTLRIGPRKKLAIPVYIEKVGEGILKWSFTSKPNCIGFSVIFHSSMEDIFSPTASEVLLSETRVNSHKHEVAGQLAPKRTGCYTLIFDNTFSKFLPKQVVLYVAYDCVSA